MAGIFSASLRAQETAALWPSPGEWREGLLSLGASPEFCQRLLAEEGTREAFLRNGIWGGLEPGEEELAALTRRVLEELSTASPGSRRFVLLQAMGGLLWQERLFRECLRCGNEGNLETSLLFLRLRSLRNFRDRWPEMPGGRPGAIVDFLRDWLSCDDQWHPLREPWQPGVAARLSSSQEFPRKEKETGTVVPLPGEDASLPSPLWLCWEWELPAARGGRSPRGLWVPPLPAGSRLLVNGKEWSDELPEGKCLMIPLGLAQDSPQKVRLSLLYPPQAPRSLLPILAMEKNPAPPAEDTSP
ncbi:MAG: hypothetical protein ACI4SG_04180 [Oligosphaeraceae bacterium]